MDRDQLLRQLEPFVESRVKQERESLASRDVDYRGLLDRFLAFLRDAIKQVDDLIADGATKKEAVIVVANRFYQEIIAPLDLPGVPNFLENRFVDPAIGRIWESLVSELVDHFVDLLRSPAVI